MFFMLMVGAPRSSASPPRGAAIDVFCVDGGCSQIYSIASQGSPPLIFFTLMVEAPGPPTAPPRGAAINVFCVDGGHS
jgi:hypothetical protein